MTTTTPDPAAEATTSANDTPSGAERPQRARRRTVVSPRVGRLLFHRPKHPWLTAAIVILVLLLLAEGWVRWVKPQLPIVRSGDAAEMILKARRLEELASTDPSGQAPLDVIFFGTSMMDSAIVPREFLQASTKFHTAYNASVVGAPAATQVRWINEVALKEVRPKMIVIGVHPIDLLLDDPLNLNIQPGQADVVFARVERELRPGVVGDLDRAFNDHVELVAQRGSLRQPKVMLDATWNQFSNNDPKPQIPLRDEDDWKRALRPDGTSTLFYGQHYKVTKAVSDLRSNLQKKDFSADDVYRLLDTVNARGRELGAEVVVVIPPVPLTAWKDGGVDLNSLKEGERLIAEASKSYGLDVIDFTDKGYPNDMFADILHSNDRGAVQFSHDLVVELETRKR